ncbi:MAG: FadR/GntR family transcriptional regulator [Devosia sp.]
MSERPAATPVRVRRSHAARVVSDLGLGVVTGALPEGGLLPGDLELLAKYGVSRTVLREALKTLSAKGLVQARARVGTRVQPRGKWNLFDPDVLFWHAEAGFRPEFLAHLAEIRLALEPEAAALAAERRTPENLKDMDLWLEQMAAPAITLAGFAKADLGFHLAVAEAAANPFFISISTLIEVVLVAMLTISSPAEEPDRLTRSVEEHRRIAKAIADGNAKAARAAMRSVIETGVNEARRAQGAGAPR